MGLALAVIFMWVGSCLIWVAAHGTQAKSPWAVYQQITGAMAKGE